MSRGTIVTPETRKRVRRAGDPVALFLGRLGLTPNGLTLIGFAITLVAALLAGLGLWLASGLVVLFGGVFDMFDGSLARATGRASAAGAFLDSVCDRWGEGLWFTGVAAGAVAAGWGGGAVLAAFAMISAVMVTYARARSEGLGLSSGSGIAQVGLAPREVRIVVLSLGTIAAGLAGGVGPSSDPAAPFGLGPGGLWLGGALLLIGILGTVTTLQRIDHTLRNARAAAADGRADARPGGSGGTGTGGA